jgi:hypothetical protein
MLYHLPFLLLQLQQYIFMISNISRMRINTLMICILTCTARSLFNILDNIATPCSVKAIGAYRTPPQLEVPNLGPQDIHLLFIQLKHKILRESTTISSYCSFKLFSFYSI